MAEMPRRIADHPINRIVQRSQLGAVGELLAWNLFPAAAANVEPA
jgi:hypothetical protein